MMTGTSDLRSEHRAVVRMLDIMDEVAASAMRGERPAPDDLTEIVRFLRVFVDTCHHAKEEQLLFPAMRVAAVADTERAIAGLLADHEHGRAAVSRIETTVRGTDDLDGAAAADLAEAIVGYTRLLRDHIVREESDCFDPADRDLPSNVQEHLNEGYERIEVDVVGGGVHEEFHALLDRLSRSYLP